MFCPKCGEKNPDGAKFCAKCGATIASAGSAPTPAPAPQPKPARRRRAPIVIAAVAVVAVVAVAAFVVTRLLGSGGSQYERTASNASRAYGRAVISSGDYDYLYSAAAGGICRIRHDGSSEELIRAVDKSKYNVSAFAMDGDRIYFVLNDFTGSYSDSQLATSEVLSVKTDGTDEKVVWSYTPTNGYFASVAQLCVHDHELFVALTMGASSSTRIYKMSVDGSNPQMLCDIPGVSSVLVMPDFVYYFASANGDTNTLYSRSLENGETNTLYASSSGSTYGPFMTNGRLVFTEYDYDAGMASIVSVAADGSDSKVIYGGRAGSFNLLSTGGDSVFIGAVSLSEEGYALGGNWSLVRVPLDGSEAQTVVPSLNLYNPFVSDMGGRLVLCENGGDVAGANLRGISVSYDGSNQVTYLLG